MNEMIKGHTVTAYNGELSKLHGTVIEMSELVREQIRGAVSSIEEEDPSVAREVIQGDQAINELDVLADEQIVSIIAKRQPVAKDLREILTVSKIVADLERMGDQARWVARLTIRFYDGDKMAPNAQMLRDIPKMAAFVDDMVSKAILAFDELDLELALEVIRLNTELEHEFKSALRRMSTYILEDARNVGNAADLVLGLRALERIGGRARNIARYVIFLVKGKDVRHENLEAITAEVMERSQH